LSRRSKVTKMKEKPRIKQEPPSLEDGARDTPVKPPLEAVPAAEATFVAGIDQAVDAFLGLFQGKNVGKMVVKLA
jgi:hypothetical protein